LESRISERASSILSTARQVFEIEGSAVLALGERLNQSFVSAVDAILHCEGRVVVTGVGKSGHIARKVAATLASLGTPSIFLHAVEASHGDFGIIRTEDIVVVVSKSGETREILQLVQMLRSRSVKIIAITSDPHSNLARYSDIVLEVPVHREADHINLAPTASTTASLAMGDALAIAVAKERGFTEKDFALFHPGGTLGRRLLLQVEQLMHGGEENPVISEEESFETALFTVTDKRLGAVSAVNAEGKLSGIITDGDIRRLLGKSPLSTVKDLYALKVKEVMTRRPKFIHRHRLATEALKMMEDHAITVLPVVDDENHPIGMVHIHDLVQAGIGESRRMKKKILED